MSIDKFFKLTVASVFCTYTLNATDKFTEVNADFTMQKSERKVVMGISRLGLEADKFTFPVYYRPAGKNAKTVKIGNWSVKIKQEYIDSILADNYVLLIPNRYDKMIFQKGSAKIATATKDIQVSIDKLKKISIPLESYKSFKNDIGNYLNSEIATKITPILNAAKDARYSEMSSKETQTFITTKAKEVGMPVSVLQKLIDSAFVFSIYMPKMEGYISISQEKYKDSKGRTVTYYSTSLNAPITLFLTLHKLNNSKFIVSKEINSKADGVFNGLSKSISGSSCITTDYMPTSSYAQKIFDDVLKKSFKDNIMALSIKLKKDRDFAIFAPIESVDGSSVTLEIGNQEDIRVDAPFKILRTEDSKERVVGYMKTKKVGDSCLLLPKERRTKSKADVIIGDAEEADLAVEHPWSGVFSTLNLTNNSAEFRDDLDKTTSGTGITNMLNLGMSADLGYILNSEAMSEIWFNFGFGAGSATNGTLTDIGDYRVDGEDGFAMKLNIGLEKRYNLTYSTYMATIFDLAYEAQAYSYEGDTSLNLATFSVTPKIKVGYMFSPNIDIFAGVGYDLPLSTIASLRDSDGNDVGPDISDKFSKDGGITASFGINMHMNFAGPFANMFAKPSSRCNVLKK